jgi:glycogen debranching enzyme
MPEATRSNTLIQATKFLPLVAMRSVTSHDGMGVYASSDTLFKGAVFGRDSLEVCEDLLATHRLLVRRSLLTLASLQGEETNTVNEEEPGKIMHEYRRKIVDGKPIRGRQLEIFNTLSQKWGGNSRDMVYYGSSDATPHFIRTLGAYCTQYPGHGERLLEEKVTLRSGNQTTLRTVTERATSWLIGHIERSESGFIEYQRKNTQGIENQVWKDSAEFYVHENGKFANHERPISSIEVQGLAYDALCEAARLFKSNREQYLQMAEDLRNRVFDLLWQPERNYFALGTDIDEAGKLRIIATKTANPAALLDSKIFDSLPDEEREKYVSAIVRNILSKDFLTDAGIRSRALSERHLVPFKDYHGSFVSWPKETYDIAKGLSRQGFPVPAKELENRLLNVCVRNLAYPEFIYVDEDGRVLPTRPNTHEHAHVLVIDGVNTPEVIQAWTVSAIVSILSQRAKAQIERANVVKHATRQAKRLSPGNASKKPERKSWQIELEKEVLQSVPHVRRLISPAALKARYPRYDFRIHRSS